MRKCHKNQKTNDKQEHCIYKINDIVSDFFSYQKKKKKAFTSHCEKDGQSRRRMAQSL